MSRMLLNQGKLEFNQMRDIEQLRKSGIDLSTTSNEVAKLWDSIIFQTFGFFDAPEVDGIQGCISKIKALDSNCPLLRIMTVDPGMETFHQELKKIKRDLHSQYIGNTLLDRKWTQFEKDQVQLSIYKWEGYEDLAIDRAFNQMAKHPLDLMTLSNSLVSFAIQGRGGDLATLAGYSRQALSKDNIYYSFVQSFEAYGLEERGQLSSALRLIEDSIALCPWNTWATHTSAHIFDAQGRPDKGIAFLDKTRRDWTPCGYLSCHNNWHTALFYLDNNNVEEALHVWDTEIISQLKEQYSIISMSDAVSLLSRIELEQYSPTKVCKNLDLTSRWSDLLECISKTNDLDHSTSFYDSHLALAMLGCRKPQMITEFHDLMKDWLLKYENRIFEEWETDFITDLYTTGTLKSSRFTTRSRVMMPLINAIAFFEDGDYQSAVNILYPIRDQFKYLGGSNTQRDVFLQLLSCALLMAGGDENTSLLKMLLFERHDQREIDNYSDRIQKRIVDYH